MSSTPRDANVEDERKIGKPTFTRDDQAQAQAYLAQRALLYDLWDLATTYPNVASKIRVTIRKADPRKDYRYDDDEFADAAIVVSLSWIDAKRACEFLNCVSTYPRNGRCRSRENPRVYPSGDRTTLVACQPACFMMSAIRTSYGRTLDSTELSANEYKSSVAHVMSAHSSEYRKVERNRSTTSASSKYAKLTTTTMSAVEKSEDDDSTREPRAPSDESPDLPTLEYDESSDSCEMANSGLITYATQPYFRTIDDGGGATCRLTNFHIGDDVITKKIVPDSADNDVRNTLTARHSRTYCDGFDKEFDEQKSTCYEPWWEQVLSYTFVGSALVRLARHAVAGGDRCDTILPTSRSRPEINVDDFSEKVETSRYHWFRDVDSTWCLPPPNVLLSDLGIEHIGQSWSNVNGGTIETNDSFAKSKRRFRRAVVTSSSERDIVDRIVLRKSTSSPFDRDQRLAASLLQASNSRKTTTTTNDRWDSDYIGRPRIAKTSSSKQLDERRKRDTTNYYDDNDDTSEDTILDFDAIYENLLGGTGSENMRQILAAIGMTIGEVGSEIAVRSLTKYIVRSAYSRTLRFVGRDLAGRASRTLVGLGVRTTTARMVSTVFARFSTRVMTALGTTASGIGTILGIVEIIGILLDFMILFGWDPGNYNSEFTNDIYDDMAVGWIRQCRFNETVEMSPELFLSVFKRDREGAVVPDGGSGQDESLSFDDSSNADAEMSSLVDKRLVVRTRSEIPWFFEKFPDAMNSMIDDQVVAKTTSLSSKFSEGERSERKDSRRTEYSRLLVGRRRPFVLKDDPLLRTRPVLADNPMTTNILLSMHYFAHRPTNSLGQRVDTRGDRIRLNDAAIANAVRDNELASFLDSAYSKNEVPRATLLATARRNVVAKLATYGTVPAITVAFVWTVATTSIVVAAIRALSSFFTLSTDDDGDRRKRLYRRTNLVIAATIVATTFLFILPLTLGVFFLETVIRGDDFDRSFERWPVSSFSPERESEISETKSTENTTTAVDSDAIDRACDLLVDFARSSFDDDDEDDSGNSLRDVPARAIASILRRELRVIYNV